MKDRNKALLDITPRFEDMTTSPIGLGMAALGRPGYINLDHGEDLQHQTDIDAMRDHALAMLDAAHALGIRYFDVASSYGLGEKFLGHWLFERGYHIEGVTVASKWGYRYTADWRVEAESHEIKDHSLANLKPSHVWSCLHLGRAMKVYQIHSVTAQDRVLDDAGVLAYLQDIRRQGRLIGLTTSGPGQAAVIEKALTIRASDGEPLFGLVQATWNPLEPSAGEMLARARQNGMAVIVKEALANGRLGERNQEPGFSAKLASLRAQAERLGCGVDALVMAAAVNQPWADVVLSGATTPEQLQSNCKALAVCWDDEAAAVLAALAESPEAYWQHRAGLAWN